MNTPRTPVPAILRAVVLLVMAAAPGLAEPAHKLVAAGNEAFQAGDFAKALALYDEASVEIPESAQLYFNRGTALYKQENYEEARTALKEAAVRSVAPELAARARFNLGNCAFRQAERQRDSDPKKAIEHCQEAIAFYQEARDLDHASKDASENIEIVRLFMKILFDEQKQREEEQQKNQEQEENIVQKLQKLIERQNGLIKENREVAGQKPEDAHADKIDAWKKSVADLSGGQGVLRDDTRAVLEEIEQMKSQLEQQAAPAGQGGAPNQPAPQSPPGQTPPSPDDMKAMAGKFGAAAGHVTNAIASEQAAMAQLAAAAQPTALKNQESAAQSLEEAVKAIADPNQQQQQQQSGDQQNQDQDQDQNEEGQEDQKDQEDQSKEGEKKEGPDDQQKKDGDQQEQQDQKEKEGEPTEEEQAAQARMERAEDILNEEKENRRPARPVRGIPVDRDW